MPKPVIDEYGIPDWPVVVVTGSRSIDPTYYPSIAAVLQQEHEQFGQFTLVHGDAVGLDRQAHRWATLNGIQSIGVPYFGWLRGAGGPVRNAFMIDEYKPRTVIGFHKDNFENLPVPGSGTGHCFKYALDKSIPRCEWVLLFGSSYNHIVYFRQQETLL